MSSSLTFWDTISLCVIISLASNCACIKENVVRRQKMQINDQFINVSFCFEKKNEICT